MTNQERKQLITELYYALEYCISEVNANPNTENVGLCYIFQYEFNKRLDLASDYLRTDIRYNKHSFFWYTNSERYRLTHKVWYAPRIAWLKTHIAKLEKELL